MPSRKAQMYMLYNGTPREITIGITPISLGGFTEDQQLKTGIQLDGNNGSFTYRIPGAYAFHFDCSFELDDSTQAIFYLYKNGIKTPFGTYQLALPSVVMQCSFQGMLDFIDGDYIQIYVYSNGEGKTLSLHNSHFMTFSL